jgi:hypothetical protein
MSRIDLSGQRFGRLTVSGPEHGKPGYWRCACDCGNTSIGVHGSHLRKGKSKSCGCLRIELVKAKNLAHGMSARGNTAKIYWVWAGMLNRCNSPKHISYEYYGGRGIKVCERWKKFENFYADMGDPPAGHWIDRIDGNADYEPDNCRWATTKQQRANQRPRHGNFEEVSA